MIENFQIPYEDYTLLNKTYDYIKSNSKINIRFSSDFSYYEKLPKDVKFRLQISDNNDKVYSQDKIDTIKYNGDFTLEINFDIDKDIKDPVIQFFILKDYIDYFVPGEMFLDGYYFNDCIYKNFLFILLLQLNERSGFNDSGSRLSNIVSFVLFRQNIKEKLTGLSITG